MKHKKKSRKDQISLTSSESSTEPLRLQIKAKLNTLFDGFVSDLQTISQEAEPDFTELLDSHVSQFVNGNNHNGNASSSAPSLDHSLLQNFVNSAKSRLSDLLNQEKSCVSNSPSTETTGKPTKVLKKSGYVDPLQTHISQKVQSLLCKALDGKLANGSQKNHSDSFIDSELEGFTSVLQNFVNSAKRKISISLSDGQSPSHLPATSHIVGAKKSELCNIVSPGGSRSVVNQIDPFNSDSKGAETHLDRRNCRKSSLRSSSKMYSPCDIDCLEEVEEVLCIPDARNCNKNAAGGMLLLEDADRAPEFLDIEINTDVEDDSSDEDVIVLGEKRPTYEEITLEEDDDEDDDDPPEKKEDDLFKCPQCEKAFRVESLLKFHVRMHGSEDEGSSSLKRRSNNNEEERPTKAAKNHESSIGKDKENQTNPNTSQSKKSLKPGRRKQTSKH